MTFNLRKLRQLRLLNLSHNAIKSLSYNNMKAFDGLPIGQLTIDLSENNFLCTCETLKFLKWMNNHRIKKGINLFNYDLYFCTLPNSTIVFFHEMNRVLETLETQCSSYIGIIVACVVASTAFLVTVFSGCIYQYRWKLRYIYYMTKQTYKRSIKGGNSSIDRLYRYDAFISYANEDRHIALEFKENAEDKNNLRLCFHERDFIPGVDIAENIVSAIHESRKVVFIISENFLKSHWCMYEFNMTHIEQIHSRADEESLFLVLLGDFDSKKAPRSMLNFIHKSTYLEFPDDRTTQPTFWLKMNDVLNKKR